MKESLIGIIRQISCDQLLKTQLWPMIKKCLISIHFLKTFMYDDSGMRGLWENFQISLPLNALLIQIIFLSRDKVRSHDSTFLSSSNCSREYTSKSVESSLVTGGNHFTAVHHKWSFRVTWLHGESNLIIIGSFIQQLCKY